MTHAISRRRILPVACIGLAAVLVSGLGTGATAAPAPAPVATRATTASVMAAAPLTAASPPSAAHPFSDPIWSPLRTAARVNCVLSNCPGPYHGYWAIDFIGNLGDPLYAAGAGIFHIGKLDYSCATTRATAGTWVWIDHGGGRTTQYNHLNKVLAREGQLVTPATQIGEIGHSGHVAPCLHTFYLHMEFHMNGFKGPKVSPGTMLTCTQNGRISMPTAFGYPTWNDVPTNQNPRTGTKPNIYTPTATNNCMAGSRGADTPVRPTVSGRRGPGSATISWGVVPAGVNHTLVTIDQWWPSQGKYGTPKYRVVQGRASSTKFTGLVKGRPYRLRATTHNGAGYSAWTAYVRVTPTR